MRLGETILAPVKVLAIHQHAEACRDTRLAIGGTSCAAMSVCGSGDGSAASGGVCGCHYVLLQDHYLTTIVVAISLAPATPAATCRPRTWHECITCSSPLDGPANPIRASLSREALVLGQIRGKALYVWEVCEEKKKLVLMSDASISLQWRKHNRCGLGLIALGKHLSIVWQTGTTPSDMVYIIQTESGRVLNEVSISATLPASCWYLLSPEALHWLSDVTVPCPQKLLTMVDSAGHSFALIRQAATKSQHSPSHWVQAVNCTFQNNDNVYYSSLATK